MKQSILNLVCINAVFFTMSLSICAHSQVGVPASSTSRSAAHTRKVVGASLRGRPIVAVARVTFNRYATMGRPRRWDAPTTFPGTPDTRRNTIFVFHTDEFWLNLHHFLYVLGRAENKERDTSREAVASAPGDQQRGLEQLSAKEQIIWRQAVASYAAGPSKKDLVF